MENSHNQKPDEAASDGASGQAHAATAIEQEKLKREVEKWRTVVAKANIKAEMPDR